MEQRQIIIEDREYDFDQLSETQIAQLTEKALVDYVMTIASHGNRPCCYDERIGWVKTDPTAWSNYIFYCDITKMREKNDPYDMNESMINEKIDHIIAQIKRQQLPKEWLVGPLSKPKDLCERLEHKGFILKYKMKGMALDLLHMDFAVRIPEEVQIMEVTTVELLEQWADVISNGLWHGDPFEASLFKPLLGSFNYKLYLAFYQGKAVSASMLQMNHGVAAMDLIATLDPYQRRGIGTAVTKIPLLYAREQGYQIAVLQASQAGEHGYRKIGFGEYCQFNVYRYREDMAESVTVR